MASGINQQENESYLLARGVPASLEIPTASAVGASPQQEYAKSPTAYAVGIPAISFVNHWLTPVVRFKLM